MVRICIPLVLMAALCTSALGASTAGHRQLACDNGHYTLEVLEGPPNGEAVDSKVPRRHRLAKRGVSETYVDGSRKHLSIEYAGVYVEATLQDHSSLTGTTKFLLQLESVDSPQTKCFKVMHKDSDSCVGMCSIEDATAGVKIRSAAGPIDAHEASGRGGYLWIRFLRSGVHVWDFKIVREAIYGKVITFHL